MMEIVIYAGNAGDRNERGMRGSVALGTAIAERYGVPARIVGEAVPPVRGGWAEQLHAAMPNLLSLSQQVAERLERDDGGLILTMGRCAASIATLPPIARHHPDVAIVWFDAHGDCNVPATGDAAAANYLGGMVLTGAAGEWDTGLGRGLNLANVILVGARDLDPPEQARIDSGQIVALPVGDGLAARLEQALRGRRVYIHLDCDVLDAGLLATEYQMAGGLGWAELREAFEMLALHRPVGLEIAEYEATWPDGTPSERSELLVAIHPVLTALQAAGRT
ncbi:hypothetical protein ASG11_01465 [Sphingomonas sp. Leaf357]|uniref:arginase family protein n=1 Tax=Sphingomonas sp. Leaf357 TaxID=1736350 RepID=UPI0006F4C927|nr:arginase family protein [Sphingomonas sp. Leaf357]KQS03096.1 hypothetical protein ASG11_01465 [Sphingomonas sp. Leaf357]